MTTKIAPNKLKQLLKEYFSYTEFRPGQLEIINSVLDGNDTLAVMPTGGGKSMCYQIPALVFSGLTIVVSPLIALMQDQVDQLDKAGIPSLFLNSTLEWDEYVNNMAQIRKGKIKLLYCAPETLITDRVQDLLSKIDVSCITIDEAHCISEWGHDFRPEYRRISELREMIPNAVCLALTATATKNVRDDIKKTLKLGKINTLKANEFISSFDRPNIFLEVRSKSGKSVGKEKPPKGVKKVSKADEIVLSFLRTHQDENGIIYCFSRKQVDALTKLLTLCGIPALPYHAGLTDEERIKNQTGFIHGDISVIVATVAFGMGINKPDVRFVIHYDLPKSLEQYYQEIGRAGRDGEPAHALLLYSYGDTRKIQFFIQEKTGRELEVAKIQLKAMVEYAEARKCRRRVLLGYFGESLPENEAKSPSCCDVCATSQTTDTDMTIPVQKLLSCILRTGERYGTAYIVDILLGSRQKRILDNKHNKLSVYGIGKEYTKSDWFNITALLIESGFLRKSADYQVLSLTQDAHDTLRERGKVFLPF